MTSSYDSNEQGFTDSIGDVAEDAVDKWRSLSGRTKKIIAGGTAVATLGGIAGGLVASDHTEQLSPEGIQNGQLNFDEGTQPMRDKSGKAALLNYFDAQTPAEDRVLRVSLASQLPDAFRDGNEMGDYLDTVDNRARSHTTRIETYFVQECYGSGETRSCHMSPRTRTVTDHHYYKYDLEIERDFVPANSEQAQQVHEYFREFERLTGIEVKITRDDPDAHIIIANYRNKPDYYRGSLDYVNPNEIATYPEGSSSTQGPSLKRNLIVMNDRNYGQDNNLISEIGRPLGFEDGKVNIVTLRAELERLGLPVTELAVGDTHYELESGVKVSQLMPDNVIVDNGGTDTLQGSAKNDTLVSEAGLCGRLDTPRNKFTNIFGDGKEYCIAEGEFEVVRGGAGDDLIIAARGGSETIEPGAGDDRITYFQPEIGDTTILASADEEGKNTLYLHDDNVYRGDVTVRGDGDSITLDFTAFSGRPVGSITLPGQLAGGGITDIKVVNNTGEVMFEKDVSGIETVDQWQKDVINPMEKDINVSRQKDAQEEAARWRNDVRRRRKEEVDVDGPFI